MRFSGLETFNSINIVPCASCGQGKAKFLNQEPRTWRAERKNLVNIVTLTFVDFFKNPNQIN